MTEKQGASRWQIDCKDVMAWCAEYKREPFSALIADPPYELNFMGRDWDRSGIAFDPATWAALSEHLLPGAFIFVFGSSRGWHRLAVAIEDAGFVFHPSLMVWGWAQGAGFPKATRINCNGNECKEWEGHRYGRQALKPAVEMIICAQKPYEGRPVDSIVETGAGALFIDGARVGTRQDNPQYRPASPSGVGHSKTCYGTRDGKESLYAQGRWPPNFCLVHSPDCQRVGTKWVKGTGTAIRHNLPDEGANQQIDIKARTQRGPDATYADANGAEETAAWECVEECAARRIGEQSGESGSSWRIDKGMATGMFPGKHRIGQGHSGIGTAARFFPQFGWAAEIAERLANSDQVRYCAKASRGEREAGLEHIPIQTMHRMQPDKDKPTGLNKEPRWAPTRVHNPHPTVKPIALCRWLATLLLPPPEYAPRRILVPFAGVASEMIAASLAGWDFVHGIEMNEAYCEIGEARLSWWLRQLRLPGMEMI